MTLSGPVTQTDLCNGALALLGVAERLADVSSDDTINARRCRLALPPARDALLCAHPWNFAARRASLAAASTPPEWGYAFAYPLPADFLRLRAIEGGARPSVRFVIEGQDGRRVLLTDRAAPVKLLYTARVTQVSSFDALFTDALITRLAADLAMPVTQTRTIYEGLSRLALIRLEEAQLADSREGTVGENLPQGSWIGSRL